MRIVADSDAATISTDRNGAKRLGLALGYAYSSGDGYDLSARTGIAPEVILQVRRLLVRTTEPRLRLVTRLFGVEGIAAPNQAEAAERADLELVIDGDAVTLHLTRVALRALGEVARLPAENLSRPEYFMRCSLARADVLELARIMTDDAESLDVSVPLLFGVDGDEAPPRLRHPVPPGTPDPSLRFWPYATHLRVRDRETGAWVPEGGLRGSWAMPTWAPRPLPRGVHIYELDMVAEPGLRITPVPEALFRVSQHGGIEVDYYTDAAGQVRHFETVPGTTEVPNPVLDDAQPDATYVVHPADGRYAVVLRTDEQARVVEIGADPLTPVGTYGPASHPLVGLLGGWPGRVAPRALVASLSEPTVERLAEIGAWLAGAVGRGQRVVGRIQASYDGAEVAPPWVQVDGMVDGQAFSERILDR